MQLHDATELSGIRTEGYARHTCKVSASQRFLRGLCYMHPDSSKTRDGGQRHKAIARWDTKSAHAANIHKERVM